MKQEVLFERDGDVFIPTVLAGSPWHPGVLHGGAPAGLLAHCLEQSALGKSLQPARLNIDLMRPVPKAPLSIVRRNLRSGQRILLEEITLLAEDKIVAVATGLFVAANPVQVPDYAPRHEGFFPHFESLPLTSFSEVMFAGKTDMPPGLHTTIQLRPATQLQEHGQGRVWLHLPATVVAGSVNSPFMHAALVADFSNGAGQLRVAPGVGMINADICMHLNRLPESEWIGMDSRAYLDASGVGMVQAQLFDTKGFFAQVTQTAMPMPEYKR